MSRANFETLLQADFDATAHMSLDALVDVLSAAMLQRVFDPVIVQETVHPVDDDDDDEEPFVEINTVTLSPPTVTTRPVTGTPAPIPAGITVKDENDDDVPLVDPVPPSDRQEQGLLLDVSLPFVLLTNNPDLASVGATRVDGNLVLSGRPYYSPSSGIGVIRYDFQVVATSTSPTDVVPLAGATVNQRLQEAFYPAIVDLLASASFELPEVSGMAVSAVRVFANDGNPSPVTLALGLGGSGQASDLLPLLDPGDGMMISVGREMFDRQVAAYNDSLGGREYNFDEDRWEEVHFVRLILQHDQIRLETDITVDPHGFTPSARIEVRGPITFSFVEEDGRPKLEPNGDRLDVDLPAWLDFLRGLTDVLTLGLAELGWADFFSDTQRDVRGSAADKVGGALTDSLLGNYPSGLELFGRDVFMTRESAVMWSDPSVLVLRPEGLMLGGAARGGFKHTPRRMQVSAVHRPGNTIRTLAFGGEFTLTKERAVQLRRDSRMRIDGVEVHHRGATFYLRDRPDKHRTSDNLGEQPTFSPFRTSLPVADDFDPLQPRVRYAFNGDGDRVEV